MAPQQLVDEIIYIVAMYGDCTHGELISHFGDLVRGNEELAIPVARGRVILAVGASKLLGEAIKVLQEQNTCPVQLDISNPLTVVIDGTPVPAGMPWLKDSNVLKSIDRFCPFRFVAAMGQRRTLDRIRRKQLDNPNHQFLFVRFDPQQL
jgi:hypothetical protein